MPAMAGGVNSRIDDRLGGYGEGEIRYYRQQTDWDAVSRAMAIAAAEPGPNEEAPLERQRGKTIWDHRTMRRDQTEPGPVAALKGWRASRIGHERLSTGPGLNAR